MDKEKEILARLMSIETTENEIYKELIRIQKEDKKKRFEELQTRILVEDIYDFIRLNFDTKISPESLENK